MGKEDIAVLRKEIKEIKDKLNKRLEKLKNNESETRERIVKEKKKLLRNYASKTSRKEKLVQRLDEAERITLDDLTETSDWIKKTITELLEEVRKLQERVTSRNAADVEEKLSDIEENSSKLRSKVKFPYHLSLFKNLVEHRGEIGISESCGSGKCKTCIHMTKTNIFKSTETGEIFIIKRSINCSTKKVIYLVTCSCKMQYVGLTIRSLRARIGEHRNKSSAVSDHVAENNHIFDIIAIDTDENWTRQEIRANEKSWIRVLKTRKPYGLNKQK